MKFNATQAALEAVAECRAVAHLEEANDTRERVAVLHFRQLARAFDACRIV